MRCGVTTEQRAIRPDTLTLVEEDRGRKLGVGLRRHPQQSASVDPKVREAVVRVLGGNEHQRQRDIPSIQARQDEDGGTGCGTTYHLVGVDVVKISGHREKASRMHVNGGVQGCTRKRHVYIVKTNVNIE